MKHLTVVGISLLVVSAYLGTSCDNATANNGGQGTGATAGTGASAGSGQGGAGGGSADGVPITNGYLTQGSLKGSIEPVVDGMGSTVTVASGHLCASGNVVQNTAGNAWGAGLVWYLNQDQAADPNPADLTAFTRIVVGISGADGLTLRLQMAVPAADGGTWPQYCTSLPTTGTGDAGVALSSLTESCWTPGGAAFDPATQLPFDVEVAVLSDVNAAHPFDFCITRLEFLP